MIDLLSKEILTEEDINQLISLNVEESIHLDFKQAGSLEKNDKKKAGNLVKLIGIADIGKSYIVPIDWQVFEEKIRQWGMSQ